VPAWAPSLWIPKTTERGEWMKFLATILLLVLCASGPYGCAHLQPSPDLQAGGPSTGDPGADPPEETADDAAATDQQHIDDALYSYQLSQELWNQGRLDEAITALDQSYESMLAIPPDHDPEILQQKEDLRLLISKRILEIYASRSKTAHVGGDGAIPLVLNDYVKREIKAFQTDERSFFVQSYRRSGRYRPYIVAELKKAGLPQELSWLPLIESGFKEKALSRARALGLWQFIASTGYRFDLKRDRWVDQRMDFRESTRAAIAFLSALHDLFGDWTTAVAAYNCGEGNVLRAIRQQKVNYLDNFWDLYPLLPSETARYVPRFLATLQIVKNPEKYGFHELVADPPLAFDEVTVDKPMQLADVAKALGTDPKELAALNPALRHGVTPEYPYTLRVPPGLGETLAGCVDQIPRSRMTIVTYTWHRVRRGQTLSQIARRYRTSVRAIARLNRIRNVSRIRVGQRLKVPLRHPVARIQSDKAYANTKPPGRYIRYRVRRGDTLWDIARRHKTSVRLLKRINGLRSNALRAGQILKVPADT